MNAWRWVFEVSADEGIRGPLTAMMSSTSTSRRVPVNETLTDGASPRSFDEFGLST